MRKRQISNMHGGYRGSGIAIDWHTTYRPSMIQIENKPLPPINNLPPTNDPPSINDPPQIVQDPYEKMISDKAKIMLVGVSAASIAAAGYYGSRYIGDILNIRRINEMFPNYRRGIMEEGEFRPLLGGNPDDIDIEDIDQRRPSLIEVEGNGPRERFYSIDL